MAGYHTGSGNPRRSLELMWPEDNPASKPGPKPKLTVDDIVKAAIDIADTSGLAALSMRSVAEKLGVGTMSLYRYLPGKGELLDLMVDRTNAPTNEEYDLYPTIGWREAMELLAHNTWDLYIAHPWLLEINQSRPVFGPNMLTGFELILAHYTTFDISDKERIACIMAIDNFITGCARTYLQPIQQDSAELETSDDEFWEAQMPYLEKAMQTEKYPHVANLSHDVWDDTAPGHPHPLHYGFSALLDGLEIRLGLRSLPRRMLHIGHNSLPSSRDPKQFPRRSNPPIRRPQRNKLRLRCGCNSQTLRQMIQQRPLLLIQTQVVDRRRRLPRQPPQSPNPLQVQPNTPTPHARRVAHRHHASATRRSQHCLRGCMLISHPRVTDDFAASYIPICLQQSEIAARLPPGVGQLTNQRLRLRRCRHHMQRQLCHVTPPCAPTLPPLRYECEPPICAYPNECASPPSRG